MRLIWDVTVDLWQFVCNELTGHGTSTPIPPESAGANTALVSTAVPVLPEIASSADSDTTVTVGTAEVATAQRRYVRYATTACYLRPASVADTRLGWLAYATPVLVRAERDTWVHVETSALEGWVTNDSLTDDAELVTPEFTTGVTYDADHTETKKLRAYIDDEFATAAFQLPLLPSEYVWYRLVRAGYTFTWPAVRPRTPGRWREILRTATDVHCGTVPLTDSVLECTIAGVGAVYYVDAVTPESEVVVSGFDSDGTGTFVTRTLAADDPMLSHAVFICPR